MNGYQVCVEFVNSQIVNGYQVCVGFVNPQIVNGYQVCVGFVNPLIASADRAAGCLRPDRPPLQPGGAALREVPVPQAPALDVRGAVHLLQVGAPGTHPPPRHTPAPQAHT